MTKFLRNQAGDTIVEVAISIAILTAILTTSYALATQSFKVGTTSRERTEAVNIAKQQAEMLRQYRDAVQTEGAPGTYPITLGTWYMSAGGAAIQPNAGAGSSGLYTYSIANAPSAVAAPPPGSGNLAINNYIIRVAWEPAIGNSAGEENVVTLKLTLADRKNFVLRQCEDATSPECSNLEYP